LSSQENLTLTEEKTTVLYMQGLELQIILGSSLVKLQLLMSNFPEQEN